MASSPWETVTTSPTMAAGAATPLMVALTAMIEPVEVLACTEITGVGGADRLAVGRRHVVEGRPGRLDGERPAGVRDVAVRVGDGGLDAVGALCERRRDAGDGARRARTGRGPRPLDPPVAVHQDLGRRPVALVRARLRHGGAQVVGDGGVRARDTDLGGLEPIWSAEDVGADDRRRRDERRAVGRVHARRTTGSWRRRAPAARRSQSCRSRRRSLFRALHEPTSSAWSPCPSPRFASGRTRKRAQSGRARNNTVDRSH